jgi:hypothetical protein
VANPNKHSIENMLKYSTRLLVDSVKNFIIKSRIYRNKSFSVRQIPFVSLISSSLFFIYSKSWTIEEERSSNLVNSISKGFNFPTFASFGFNKTISNSLRMTDNSLLRNSWPQRRVSFRDELHGQARDDVLIACKTQNRSQKYRLHRK